MDDWSEEDEEEGGDGGGPPTRMLGSGADDSYKSESRYNLDIFLDNKVMVLYAKCGSLVDAR